MTTASGIISHVPWSFEDRGSEVFIKLKVSSDDLGDVQITGDSLLVRKKGTAGDDFLMRIQQLYSTVDAEKSGIDTKTSTENATVIHLQKLAAETSWPHVEAATETPQQPDSFPDDPLQARLAVGNLLLAAQEGDIGAFKAASQPFEAKELGSVKDANGRTALHFAAARGHTDLVNYLISEEHIPVDAADEARETALALAAGTGMLGPMRALLAHGANPVISKDDGPQPIHRAACSGNVECLEVLIERGAAIDAPSASGTPLLWAISSGSEACINFLLDHGADVNCTTENGTSACLLAVATGNDDLLQRLIEKGASVNQAVKGGATPLHIAADIGSTSLIQTLLAAGADPDAREDHSGGRPIHAAAAGQHRAAVELLLPRTTPEEDEGEESTSSGNAAWSVDGLLESAAAAAAAHNHAHGGGCCGGHHDHVHDHHHHHDQEEVAVPPPEEHDVERAAQLKRSGDEAFVKGDFPAAQQHYTGALRHDTSDHALWANRSAASLRMGHFQEALLDARRARTINPQYAKAYFREGQSAEALEQWEDAAQAYFQGCRCDPNNIALAKAFNNVIQKARAAHTATAH